MFIPKFFKHQVLDWVRYQKNLYTNARVEFNVERFKNSKNKKDGNIIKKEMKALKEYWGNIPLQYITHDFYSKNCTLDIEGMKDYIPGYFFYYVIYPEYDDIKKVTALIENKIKAYYLFKKLGYRTMQPIFLDEQGFYDPVSSTYLDGNDFSDWLRNCCSSKIFIKPVDGRGGKGIIIAHRKKERYLIGDVVFDCNYKRKLNGCYVIEPGIVQLPYVAALYSNSVNTLRVITKRDKHSNKVSIIAITLRMGCDGREVDNSSQGGLLMGIDIEKGTPLFNYAVFEYGSERFYEHPDSGYKFSDFYIRDWPSFKEAIIAIADSMKEINLAGWDIAITAEGPLVIETNVQFGIDHTQAGVGGLKKHFVSGSPMELLK